MLEEIRRILHSFPIGHYKLTKWFFGFLVKVTEKGAKNKMTAQSLVYILK